ncbi:MAG TPA: hypothetical protein VJB98_02565 [Candidatus Paceibacterota bacterium]
MTNHVPHQGRTFWSLLVLFLVMAVMYVFFIQSSIFYLVTARTWSQDASGLAANVGKLEVEYYELSRSISEEVALHSGFAQVQKVSYVRDAELEGQVSLDYSGNRAR